MPSFLIMSQYDPKFDLKMNVGHNDLYYTVQLPYIALNLENYFMYNYHTFRYETFDRKINVGSQ